MSERTSNKNCRSLVERKVGFKANNIFSEWKDGKYIVYSYGKHFPMFIFKNRKWYENSDKYSSSTSKQQTHARPFKCVLIQKSTKEMQEIIS
jgi:hypothetical protein